MRVETLIIDNFYEDPDEVREFALSQPFTKEGNYPGYRTKSFLDDEIKEFIQEIIYPFAGKIINWGGEYSGSFQYTTSDDRSWIHSDSATGWAAVVYLTPNAPHTAGTGIFRHKETGIIRWDDEEHTEEENENAPHMLESRDYTKWDMIDKLGNVYNRMVLYRGDLCHVSLDYFGKNKNDGRLFQVFFFSSEN